MTENLLVVELQELLALEDYRDDCYLLFLVGFCASVVAVTCGSDSYSYDLRIVAT